MKRLLSVSSAGPMLFKQILSIGFSQFLVPLRSLPGFLPCLPLSTPEPLLSSSSSSLPSPSPFPSSSESASPSDSRLRVTGPASRACPGPVVLVSACDALLVINCLHHLLYSCPLTRISHGGHTLWVGRGGGYWALGPCDRTRTRRAGLGPDSDRERTFFGTRVSCIGSIVKILSRRSGPCPAHDGPGPRVKTGGLARACRAGGPPAGPPRLLARSTRSSACCGGGTGSALAAFKFNP